MAKWDWSRTREGMTRVRVCLMWCSASPPKGERRSPQHLFRPRHTLDGAKMRASVRMTRYLESWGAAKPFAHLHHRDSMTTENGKISTTVCLPWSHGHGGRAGSSCPSHEPAISSQNHACQKWWWPLNPWVTKWINQTLLSLMKSVWYLEHLMKAVVNPWYPAHGHYQDYSRPRCAGSTTICLTLCCVSLFWFQPEMPKLLTVGTLAIWYREEYRRLIQRKQEGWTQLNH